MQYGSAAPRQGKYAGGEGVKKRRKAHRHRKGMGIIASRMGKKGYK